MAKLKGRKADFQKIKLKVGRRLPKGLNVTDTSFKSKKVIIKNRHLKETPDDGSSRKRGIKEILARLQHYNTGTRHECLISLKEHLTSNPVLVQSNIASLIERVCELIVDKDKQVRKAVLAVLTEMLQHVTADFISPFFPIITSYLCCAMTHIYSDIQQDSLKVLDLLLNTFPHQTVSSSNQILKNFLNQISSDRDGTKERILLVKPGDNLTSQKWRLEVLQRVQNFLSVLLEMWDTKAESEMSVSGSVIEWDGAGSLSVGLLQKGLDPVIADKFSFHDLKSDKTEIKNTEQAREFALVLLPLMLEIWLEASPDKKPHEIGNLLSSESSGVLECVLRVMLSLTQWLEKLSSGKSNKNSKNIEWLEKVFYKDFESFFLKAFPYSSFETPVMKRKGKHHSIQTSLLSHNLLICQIFVALKPTIDEISVGYYEDTIEYLLSALNSKSKHDQNYIAVAIKIVQTIIKNNIHHPLAVMLLEKFEWMWKNWPPGVEGQSLIETFFMEIISSHSYSNLLQTAPVASWLRQLPKDIIDSTHSPERMMELLEKASDIASCQYPAFIEGLQSCEDQIIGLLEDMPFSEEELFKAQRHIMNLIYNFPKINEQTFRQLAQVLHNPELEVRNVDYLLQNLNLRLQTKDEPGFLSSHYLSLVICTQFGIVQEEAPLIQHKFQSSSSWMRLQHFMPEISSFVVVPSDYDIWERHQLISAKAVRYVWDFAEVHDVRTPIFTYVIHVLEHFNYLPAHATAGILSVVAPFLRESAVDECGYSDSYTQLRFNLFELVLSALTTAAALTLLANDRPTSDLRVAEMIFEMIKDFVVDTESMEPLCKLLERNVSCLKGVSEAQGECLGLILSKLLKFDETESASLSSMAKVLQMIQALTEGHMSRSKWLNEVVYDFKVKAQMLQ